jgi:hypothetical protein
MWDCVTRLASTTMTGSPGQGNASHNRVRGSLMLERSFSSSTSNRLKSTSSATPCFKTFAGNTAPAIRTLILASTAVRWAAVMINPDFKYTPAPGCSSFRIILVVAIQGPPPSFRSAPIETIGAKSVTVRRSANANRTLPHSQTKTRGRRNAMKWVRSRLDRVKSPSRRLSRCLQRSNCCDDPKTERGDRLPMVFQVSDSRW